MSTNDQILLGQWVRERDAEAFRTLVIRHTGMVYNTCRRILRNSGDAEDVAQECFEALMYTSEKPGGYLGAWLHRVATNRAINRIDADRSRREREERFATVKPRETTAAVDDLYTHIDRAIAALPDRLRYPLVAHFLENETHEAIAETMGISRQAVTYRVGKAIERVRATLKRRGVLVVAAALINFLQTTNSEAAPTRLMANLGKLAVAGSGIPHASAGIAGTLGTLSVKAFLVAAGLVVVGSAGVLALYPRANTVRPAAVPPTPVATAEPSSGETPKLRSTAPACVSPGPGSTNQEAQAAQATAAQQEERGDGKAEVQRILESPISLEFENIHLAEIIEYISDGHNLNIAMDTRVVAPRQEPGRPRLEANDTYVTDGIVKHIDVRNVLMGDALRALCPPLGLDFAINKGIVFIAPTDRLAADGLAGLANTDDNSDPALQVPASLAFDNVHISQILTFIGDTYDVDSVIDYRTVAPEPSPDSTPESAAEPGTALEPPYVTTGNVPYIALKDVSLAQGLAALLLPLNLTYAVEDGFVWISTPERIAEESFTRVDTTNAAPELADTLASRVAFAFENTDLTDALRTMCARTHTSIKVDIRNTHIAGAVVNAYNVKALPFDTALSILLRQHDLAFLADGSDIVVTSPAHAHDKTVAPLIPVPLQDLH